MKSTANLVQSNEIDIDQIREKAKAIYMAMPIVRLLEVAIKCGVSIDLVKKWHTEDNWLQLRAAFQHKNTGRLKELLGDPVEIASRYVTICDTLIAEIYAQFDRRSQGFMQSSDVLKLSKALSAAYELHDRILHDASVIKAKTTKKKRNRRR
jgi:hypothetical protein